MRRSRKGFAWCAQCGGWKRAGHGARSHPTRRV